MKCTDWISVDGEHYASERERTGQRSSSTCERGTTESIKYVNGEERGTGKDWISVNGGLFCAVAGALCCVVRCISFQCTPEVRCL